MTKAELSEIIANGENSFVEFKRDDIDPRALARELVAFSNLGGGRVLLGVEDDGTIRGLARDRIEEWVTTVCRDKVRPPLMPTYEVVRGVVEGRDVAVVGVAAGWAVHHLWHDHHATYYVRVGSQTREADREELQRLFQRRGSLRYETQPVARTTWLDLNRPRLTDYFRRVREQAVPAWDDAAAWQRLLLNTDLLAEAVSGAEPSCSVAGLLLFGTTPQRALPQATVSVSVFAGREKGYGARLRETVGGPLVRLCDEAGTEQAPGVVEQVVRLLQPHLSAEVLDGVARVRRWTYPLPALREVLVNALVHRDYLLTASGTDVCAYADRLEVSSPGRPPNGITPDRMRAGCRAARNQLLKDVMLDYGYMEHLGMGIPRKVVKLMREQEGTDPELQVEEEGFRMVLRLRSGVAGHGALSE